MVDKEVNRLKLKMVELNHTHLKDVRFIDFSMMQLAVTCYDINTMPCTVTDIKLDKKQLLIDITLFQIAPAFSRISGYINAPSKAFLTLALILDIWLHSLHYDFAHPND